MAEREGELVYLVCSAGWPITAYWEWDSAQMHMQCIPGLTIQVVRVLDSVPTEILGEALVEEVEWADGSDGVPEPVADQGAGAIESSGAGADVTVKVDPGSAGSTSSDRKTRPY